MGTILEALLQHRGTCFLKRKDYKRLEGCNKESIASK